MGKQKWERNGNKVSQICVFKLDGGHRGRRPPTSLPHVPHRRRDPPPTSGLAYLQAFSLCTYTNLGFEESHIILKPNSEATKATPLSPSKKHHQAPKLKEEDTTLTSCLGIVSMQTISHQNGQGVAMETHTARVLHHTGFVES